LGADGAKIVRSLERIGYINSIQIIGYTGIFMSNFRELAGPGANSCYCVTNVAWTVESPEGALVGRPKEIFDKIIAAYGRSGPGGRDTNITTVGSCYDLVMLLKWAIETAGSTEPDAVKAALENRGSEYKSYYAEQFKFSPTDHDGFRVEELVPYKIGVTETAYGEIAVR
jgi:branched-chain amino acid transport system substrate-binding protein